MKFKSNTTGLTLVYTWQTFLNSIFFFKKLRINFTNLSISVRLVRTCYPIAVF
jgi:hypothetical protein